MKPKLKLLVVVILVLMLCFLPACNNEPKESTVVRRESKNVNNEEVETPEPQEPEGLDDAGGGAESPEDEIIEEPTDAPEEPDEPKVAPSGSLSSRGPWYVVANEEGLYAFNMDGSGMTILTTDVINEYTLSRSAAKAGGRIAYLTTEYTYTNPILHIVSLSGGIDHKTITLDPWDSSDDTTSDFDKEQALRALVDVPSYAWSNDGSMLAFFGIIDGPTSDLYVYSPAKDSTTRLTSGPSQGFRPFWSPDDKYIVHTGASSFGTGAGYSIKGVWAAKADGSEVISIDLPGTSGDEVFIGWRDNVTFLSYTWNALYGPHNLRFTNLLTGAVEVIWEYSFTYAVFGSQDNPSVLVAIDKYSSEDNPEGLRGLYQFSPPDYEPEFVLGTDPNRISWCNAGFFVVKTMDGYIEVRGTDRMGPYPYEGNAVYSDEGFPLWYSPDGLWVNVTGTAKKITSDSVKIAVWGADSQSIIFAARDILYVAAAPDWEPVIAAALFPTEGIVLIMP